MNGSPGGSSPAAQIHRPGKAFGKPLYSLDGSYSARNLMLGGNELEIYEAPE